MPGFTTAGGFPGGVINHRKRRRLQDTRGLERISSQQALNCRIIDYGTSLGNMNFVSNVGLLEDSESTPEDNNTNKSGISFYFLSLPFLVL
ncbi:hypothetical protein [Nitrosomonas sp.]|uniref:hypothetical protein n=1 Tax=Nitrosomonas sp. TaxID=42353 RepID=UPI0025EA3499|nr:hypothetical protein [Nitrosomonas sp.]MBV6446859.1 hypothetical protein [Nitrosomonas sp.]